MNYHIFKIEAAGKVAITRKEVDEEADMKVTTLASFRTAKLRDWTFDRLKTFMSVNEEYKDRRFI